MCARMKVPFDYNSKEEFQGKLLDWIGDVFYDILPENGYEVREEQVFTAFKIADAVCNNKVHLAEAGLGTGKTFAYLLSAIAYARFSGKPVVIACATTALQEQLAGEQGDIQTISKLLGFDIDTRMAKDPHQYICDVKVEDTAGDINMVSDEMMHWLKNTKRGERSEIPTISDKVWKRVGWDESMACDVCLNRGFCKLVKAREYYRSTKDLIIADHDIFFQDLWTREERIGDGKLPILPSYSAVIFDEGHKVLLPAAMQAGQQIIKEEIDMITQTLAEVQGARDSFATTIIKLEQACDDFFTCLDDKIIVDERSDRQSIQVNDTLLNFGKNLNKLLDHLLFEMQVEQELYNESLPLSLIQVYEGQIERGIMALNRFCKNKSVDTIHWVDKRDDSFWVVPKNTSELLEKHLLGKGIPTIFTSATLSNEGDFSYFTQSLGLVNITKSSVGSSFDLENQVVVYLNQLSNRKETIFDLKIEQLVALLSKNGGRALVLTSSLDEVRKIRKSLERDTLPFQVLWEDKGDRGYLVRTFREDETSVLIGANLWEGIDVPGEALTMLIVWELPFPSLDPIIEAQRIEARKQGLDPVITVDYPKMGLTLKQGCGRLIRTEEDHGVIVILDSVVGEPWEQVVRGALPEGTRVTSLSSNISEIL